MYPSPGSNVPSLDIHSDSHEFDLFSYSTGLASNDIKATANTGSCMVSSPNIVLASLDNASSTPRSRISTSSVISTSPSIPTSAQPTVVIPASIQRRPSSLVIMRTPSQDPIGQSSASISVNARLTPRNMVHFSDSLTDSTGLIGSIGPLTSVGGSELDQYADLVQTVQTLVHQNRALAERVQTLETVLAQKADIEHRHALSDVEQLRALLLQISNEASSSVRIVSDEAKQAHFDLQRDLVSSFQKSLNEKADKQHRHAVRDVESLTSLLNDTTTAVSTLKQQLQVSVDFQRQPHKHTVLDIEELQTRLQNKLERDSILPGGVTQVSGLQLLLDSKFDVHNPYGQARLKIEDIESLAIKLESKSEKRHSHERHDVVGLTEAFSELSNADHIHVVDQIAGLRDLLSIKADAQHAHLNVSLGSVAGLSAELGTKADLRAVQQLANLVQSLQLDLQRKADTQHGHSIAAVALLADELNKRAPLHHGHYLQHVQDLPQELAKRSECNHRHQVGEIFGLPNELQRKAELNHLHPVASVISLQEILDRKLEPAPANSHSSQSLLGRSMLTDRGW